jgi:hypothetical protein
MEGTSVQDDGHSTAKSPYSETLLNVDHLAKPFSYKLTVAKGDDTVEKVVDLPETFNYLLGLYVSTRKVYDDDGRRYLVYQGRIDHRRIAVKGLIGGAAKSWGCTPEQAWWTLMQSDQSIAGYSPAARLTGDLHDRAADDRATPFLTAVAAQSHLNTFADVSGIVVRFMELDAHPVEDKRSRHLRTVFVVVPNCRAAGFTPISRAAPTRALR